MGIIKKHHVLPKYIGKLFGIKSNVVKAMPSVSHQVITNRIRKTFSYSQKAVWRLWGMEEALAVLREVYNSLPMPRGFEMILERVLGSVLCEKSFALRYDIPAFSAEEIFGRRSLKIYLGEQANLFGPGSHQKKAGKKSLLFQYRLDTLLEEAVFCERRIQAT